MIRTVWVLKLLLAAKPLPGDDGQREKDADENADQQEPRDEACCSNDDLN
jgi:hypothetical protein